MITSSPGVVPLEAEPPAEFGGPGDRWSPETLLMASLADCFILTFRAMARASGCAWQSLECEVHGVLERVDGVTQFATFTTCAALTLPDGADEARARRLLEKAEHSCLIANSLRGSRSLQPQIKLA